MKLLQQQTQPCPDMAPRPSDDGVPLPLPSQMIAEATRHVVGQERAKRALAAALYRHYLLLLDAAECQGAVSFRPGRHPVRRADRRGQNAADPNPGPVPGRPVRLRFRDDAGSEWVCRQEARRPPVPALGRGRRRHRPHQHGIILLDEIDKLKRNDDVSGLDVSGYGAQVDLLPFLDGTDMTVHRDNKTHRFDTRRLFVVAAGAFEGIERIVERRLQERAGFGFGTSGTLREIAPERLVAEHMTPDDLVRYGLCEEFVGRFSVVCTLDPLDAGDLREILLQARGSPLAEAKAYYAFHGIDLEFDDAAIDAIVARATSQRTGPQGPASPHARGAGRCRVPAPGVGRRRHRRVSVALVDGELRVRCLEAGRRAVGVTRAEQLRAERRLARGAGAPARPEAAPFTDTRGWSDERIAAQLEVVKIGLGWGATTGAARRWWEAFEDENRHQFGLVLRLAQELAAREATISEFFIAYGASHTDNIQANLHYIDYSRLKKEEDAGRRRRPLARLGIGRGPTACIPNTQEGLRDERSRNS